MGKKMKLPLVFKSNDTHSSSSLWTWGTCKHPKTLSFRASNNSDIVKTMNSVYLNTPDSSYSSISTKTIIEEQGNREAEEEESLMVMKGLNSERFFVEVSGETSSILEEANNKIAHDDSIALVKESVAMEMESIDPFLDFRISMEEMVDANRGCLKDNWDFLEQLLACYLKVNHKSNHGYIVGAFVDLLVKIEFSSSTNTNSLCPSTSSAHSFTSPLSFYSSASSISPCLSSLMESEDEIERSVENGSKS